MRRKGRGVSTKGNMAGKNDNLLEVANLKTYFPIRRGLLRRIVGYVKAVDDVSFVVPRGKSMGLVGESGCGKTTVARTLVRLVESDGGKAYFEDQEIFSAGKKELKRLRRDISIIFQDPYGSLNPRMTVGNIIGEPIKVGLGVSGSELIGRTEELMVKVGLSHDHINRYPHEFSGGQRQRIGIARSLAMKPKLVICDEPVSALDVSIQSQILNLLKDLQEEFGLTYLFIAHDLAVVEFFCDTIAVMYRGRIVEKAAGEEIYKNPLHPYTKTLLAAIPKVDTSLRGKKRSVAGEVADSPGWEQACAFYPRCKAVDGRCLEGGAGLKEVVEGSGHFVACWKYR